MENIIPIWLLLLLNIIIIIIILGPHPRHVEVPMLGFESELQLLSCTTATAMQDPSRICDLHHSSWQRQILNTLSEVRYRTCVFMDTS